MSSANSLEFKILVEREERSTGKSAYIAHCVNFDLVAAGDTVSDVLNSLKRLIVGQIMISLSDGISPFSDFDSAPKDVCDRYEQNKSREQDAFSVCADVQPGDLEFAHCKVISGRAMMKLAA